jgi:hypothetical protein
MPVNNPISQELCHVQLQQLLLVVENSDEVFIERYFI